LRQLGEPAEAYFEDDDYTMPCRQQYFIHNFSGKQQYRIVQIQYSSHNDDDGQAPINFVNYYCSFLFAGQKPRTILNNKYKIMMAAIVGK